MAAVTGTPYASMTGRLQQPLLAALQKKGYNFMTPVQEKVLTELPTFTSDCLVQAKTGTGKTVAFLLPTLNAVLTANNTKRGDVAILIISPTRELANQIKDECDMLTAELRPAVECHTAFGGTAKASALNRFLNGKPTILVATPGRLNDYLSEEHVAAKFANLRALILDEADTMLEAGFLPAITQILGRLPPKSNGWQGMCFSATIPAKIKPVLGKVLKSNYTNLSTVDPNEVPTIEQVDQYSTIIPSVGDTFNSLAALILQERQQNPKLKAIIFGTTANGIGFLHDVYKNLFGAQTNVYELHSRLSQPARTRTTETFKAATSGLMFASDVIGRGMDFPNVDLVIQLGLPSNGEQYVHRVGRTARAGESGRAVIMLTQREKYFLHVNKHLPIKPYPVDLSAGAQQVGPEVENALNRVDELAKTKAYQAYLGFHKTFTKQLQVDDAGLVAMANEYAAAMGCPEPPMMDKRIIGKMGLRGTRGLNVGDVARSEGRPQRHPRSEGTAATANGYPAENGRVQKQTKISHEQNGVPHKQNGVPQTENGRRQGGGGGRGGRGGRANGRGRGMNQSFGA